MEMAHYSKGAEALIERKGKVITKTRPPKPYRIEEIDNALRKFRTRREAKFIQKLPVKGPCLISVDDSEMRIEMSYIDGSKVRDALSEDNCRDVMKRAGVMLAELHNAGMIHGDLTTSNMLISREELFLIDFGLSFFSLKPEDKATDLHLLKEALESKHSLFWEDAWGSFLRSYLLKAEDSGNIRQRLEQVERRGRYKGKGKA